MGCFEKTTLKPEPQPIMLMNQESRFTRGRSDTKHCLIVKDNTEYEIIYEDIYIRRRLKVLGGSVNSKKKKKQTKGKGLYMNRKTKVLGGSVKSKKKDGTVKKKGGTVKKKDGSVNES